MQKEARAAGADAEILLAPEDGNLSHWVGHVRGPVDTPYEVRFPLFFFFLLTYIFLLGRLLRGAGGSGRAQAHGGHVVGWGGG